MYEHCFDEIVQNFSETHRGVGVLSWHRVHDIIRKSECQPQQLRQAGRQWQGRLRQQPMQLLPGQQQQHFQPAANN